MQFPHDDPYRLQTAAHAGSTPMPGSLAPVALAPKQQQRNQPGSPEVIPPLQVLVCSMIYEETGRRGGGKVQSHCAADGLRTDSEW